MKLKLKKRKLFNEKLRGIDLFSGVGGITIALRDWVDTIAYCDNNRYAQAVLISRMVEGQLPRAPIWQDVRDFSSANVLPLGRIDIISGGFPCQDFSTAGRGKGLAGERSGLFYEIIRVAKLTRPPFLFLENVPAIRTRGLAEVGEQLAKAGYDCRWDTVSAKEMGAPHKRERWFCLAYSRSNYEWQIKGGPFQQGALQKLQEWYSQEKELSNSNCKGCGIETNASKKTTSWWRTKTSSTERDRWSVEPDICPVVDEYPYRMDEIKCLGNGVVPIQVKEAFKRLMGFYCPSVKKEFPRGL